MAKSNEDDNNSKKRGRLSIFKTIEALDTQDVQAEKHKKRVKLDFQRSKATQSQSRIYGSLLECRILLQRSINHLQHNQQQQQNRKQDTEQDILRSTIESSNKGSSEALDNCNQLLLDLLEARRMIQPNLDKNKTDDKQQRNDVTYKKLISVENNSEQKQQLENRIQNEYELYRNEWKEIFNRRDKDVRIQTGQLTAKNTQFRIVDTTLWQQVESTTQNEQQRWLMMQHKKDEHSSNTGNDQLNNTVWQFDDSKVYQQLLKDFLTTASSHTGQAEDVAAQARILKKQQRKNASSSTTADGTVKQVDRKASKGRKIRYAEIPKLVNFTFPLARPPPPNNVTGIAINESEWFNSLFGGPNSWKR